MLLLPFLHSYNIELRNKTFDLNRFPSLDPDDSLQLVALFAEVHNLGIVVLELLEMIVLGLQLLDDDL